MFYEADDNLLPWKGYYGLAHRVESKWHTETLQHTLFINLKDEFFAKFKKNYRNEIRSELAKGRFYTVIGLKSQSARFILIQNLKSKRIINILKFFKKQYLTICVKYEDQIIAAHLYYVSKKFQTVRLVYSAYESDKGSGISASANKFLHYSAMMHFQKNDINFYDLGGVSKDNNSVDQFKRRFGGDEKIFYNYKSKLRVFI